MSRADHAIPGFFCICSSGNNKTGAVVVNLGYSFPLSRGKSATAGSHVR